MKLSSSQSYWNRMGDADPMWAILSAREKLGGHWKAEEFFATGRLEIDGVLHTLEKLTLDVDRTSALDFGCGIGRLSQALCERFERVTGVDIASTMIEQARLRNRFPERCTYRVNDTDDLSQFESATFGFVYSSLVLQHIAPAHSARYLREFVRVAKPGGLVVFQLPERNPALRRSALGVVRRLVNASPALVRLYRTLFFRNAGRKTLAALPPKLVTMEGIARDDVIALLAAEGAEVLHLERDPTQEFDPLVSWFYVARKKPAAIAGGVSK